MGAEPVGAEPVGAEPVGAEPVGAEPVGAEPVGLELFMKYPSDTLRSVVAVPSTALALQNCSDSGDRTHNYYLRLH